MDCVLRAAGPDVWRIEGVGGGMLGAVEKRSDGFVIVPSVSSPLRDLDPLPYASLEAAMAGIAAHLQGACSIDGTD